MNPAGNLPLTASSTTTATTAKGGTALKVALGSAKGSIFSFSIGIGTLGVGVLLVTAAVVGYNYWEKKREMELMGEDPTEILSEGELFAID
jgi:hypothetical protein